MTHVNVYLNFDGQAEEAFNFYKSVFGGEFTGIYRFKDMPMEGVDLAPAEADRVVHVGLPIGPNSVLMASDNLPSLGHTLVHGNNAHVSVHPTSRDEADRLFNGLAAGGTIEMPVADQSWGDYYGSLKDKFGVQWMVNHTPPSG